MDPNEKLLRILDRARAQKHLGDGVSIGDGSNIETALDNADELADDILELHEWLHMGGFLPAAWVNGTSANSGRTQAV